MMRRAAASSIAMGILAIAVTAAVACGDPYEADSSSGGASSSSGGVGAPAGGRAELPIPSADFGLIACGTAPQNLPFEIKNAGTGRLEWVAALSTTTQFAIVGAANGVIEPSQTGVITLSSAATLAEDLPGTSRDAVLTITTNDPEHATLEAIVKITSGGGALEILPPTVAFGESPVGVPALDVPVSIRNTGNLPIAIAIQPPTNPQFAIESLAMTGSIQVEPETELPDVVTKFTPSAKNNATATASITVTGPTCGKVAANLELAGIGTDSAAAVQPAIVDFGYVPCGGTAAAKTVTILNAKELPFEFTVTTALGRINVAPLQGTVPPKSSVTLSVTPKTVPTTGGVASNLYGDTLTVTTTAPGDLPHPVAVRVTPRGAIFTYSRSLLDFGNVKKTDNNGKTETFVLTNSGNYVATLNMDPIGAGAYSMPAAVTLVGGSSSSINVKCKPGGVGNKDGHIATSTATSLCRPMPPDIQLRCKIVD